ncbi:Uncharacterized protein Adt_27581 [Abeliophyllum distichum]|uniref:Uncharacterized protein n=1 Tax=Abeliophyllum distichum TaxID=126358 RepID=A0ABD1RUF3_9LAMI
MAAKRSRRERPPSSSSEEEVPQATQIDRCLVLIVSFRDTVALLPKAIDTINTISLICMKIVKEDRQWVAKSKGFDDESGPSILLLEDSEEMHEDKDEPPRPRSQRPSSSTSGFTEDHFNLLNGLIDSLIS